MTRRKSLGRGLEALLSSSGAPAAARNRPETELKDLPIDLLSRGRYQPRIDMHEETLVELAESIKAQGVVQPIVVRSIGTANSETRYEIIAGERRWRAAQLAGLEKVPALVRDIPDEAAVAVALIENIQRENLNPIEEARALERLVTQFDMTHSEAAEAVGRSRVTVSNLLRLLELPTPVIELLESRQLDMGHGRALLGLPSADQRIQLARRAVAQGWSVRATESAVRRQTAGTAAAPAAPARKDPNVASLEQNLAERLGAPVAIESKGKGGRLVIRFGSLEELEGILDHIK